MNISTDPKKIERLLTHQVDGVIVKEDLEKKLKSGKQLRIKLGADPSRPDLHIGHAVVLRKLRDFQDLGHKVIFLIGDFTGLVGDPTGKSKTRPQLTEHEIKKNAKTYFRQVGKMLDVKKCDIVYNSKWLGKMKAADFVMLASKFTAARILERDDFEKRMKAGTEIHVHELLYPMLQAQDSVELEADVEVGGTDQTFNMLAGRELAKKLGETPQDVITCPLLVGTDGVQKMSKSLDNYIAFEDPPEEMYGKTMSIPDSLIENWLNLAVDLDKEEIDKELDALKKGDNPRDVKARLAKRIVAEYYDEKAAKGAEKAFLSQFRDKQVPEEMAIYTVCGTKTSTEVVADAFNLSKSEARRQIEQGAVRLDGDKLEDPNAKLPKTGEVLQKGKRHFRRLKRTQEPPKVCT